MASKKNIIYIAAGCLYLLSFILMPDHYMNNPVLGLCEALTGFLIIILGFSARKQAHLIALIAGFLISAAGTFGIIFSLTHPETNSIADVMSAFSFGISGYLLLIGSIKGLNKKKSTT